MTRTMYIIPVVLCQLIFVLCDPELPNPGESKVLCDLGCECPPFGMFSYLICSQKNISKLPDNIQFRKDIREITFRENSVHNISRYTFLNAPYLEELDLSQNRLQHVEDSSFIRLTGLLVLHLSNNELTVISSKLLYGLRNLELLELGHNKLSVLPEALFEPVPGLKELKLQSNSLTSLDQESFQHLTLLEKLDLENNGLRTLSTTIFLNIRRVHWLSLADNKLETVPTHVFHQTPMLRSLDLSGNDFTTLETGSFSSLFNLSSLYLNNLNSLIRIEKEIVFNMSSLKLISCNYNQNLRFVHADAFKRSHNVEDKGCMAPIEKIFLGHNGLKTLEEPADLETWMKTDSADLGDNPWHCDCKLRWMTRLKHEISGTVRCSSPLYHHGRVVSHMKDNDFICDNHWAFSTILLVMTSLVAFSFFVAFGTMLVCGNTFLGKYLRAKVQFSYVKVDPKQEIDLEWDPSAEMMK